LILRSLARKEETKEISDEYFDLIPIGIVKLNTNGEVLLINQLAIDLLGISNHKDQIIGERLVDFVNNLELLNKIWKISKTNWSSIEKEQLSINNNQLEISGNQGNGYYLLNVIDITNTTKVLDQATQSLLIGQENEKRRISKEIHDGIGQAISTVKLHLDYITQKVSNSQRKRDLHRVNDMVSEIADDLRNLSHDLLPSSLVDFGVVTTVKNLAKRINRAKSHNVVFKTELTDKDIDLNYALNIYRIVQELINNSIKHSQCKEVTVNLSSTEKTIKLIISDDGVGCEELKISDGIGLYNIKNRLSSLNAELRIITELNKGFKAIIRIPRNPII